MVPRAVLDDEDELTIYPDTAAVLEIGGAATVSALHEAAVTALTPGEDSLSLSSDSDDGEDGSRPTEQPGSRTGNVRKILSRVWARGRDLFVFAALLVFVTVVAVVGYFIYLFVRERNRLVRRARAGPAWTRLRNQSS